MNKIKIVRLISILGMGMYAPMEVEAQSSQNPSPMVEHVREHPRLTKTSPAGRREKLNLGQLFIPEAVVMDQSGSASPLVIAFHCGDWIPEMAVAGLSKPLPCISMQLGSGSGRYSKPFVDDRQLFGRIVGEAETKLGRPVSKLLLVGWSAGYGAIRELISDVEYEPRISSVLLLDGLHTGYVGGKPGPLESKLEEGPLKPFLAFARKAIKGEKQFHYLHTEIFPGTFASTTETADWLLAQLALKRKAVLRWGPMRTQHLAETVEGRLRIDAFAGNSAPDHVDLLHGLPLILQDLVNAR
ncbi:MAG: hypothetical protein DWI24_05970 [Planctomycetota bacterium]|nr:MAG: hypothetical protein DWI24_05970 [Planctomycetota bacterium]